MTSSVGGQVEDYLRHLVVERGLSDNTVQSYRRDLLRYQEYLRSRGVPEADAKDLLTLAFLREALEEVGVRLDAVDAVASAFSCPGVSTERLFLFLGAYQASDRVEAGGGRSGREDVLEHRRGQPSGEGVLLADVVAADEVDLPGDSAEGGRGSSHVWGNLQTVEWNRATGVLSGGSDPRNDVGEAKVEPAAR